MAPKRKAEDVEGPAAKKAAGDGLVNKKRVNVLKKGTVEKGPVVYWMSRDQRVADNWALLYALEQAAATGSPVAVAFNLVPAFLGAGARQFCFMLKGLREVQASLKAKGIPFFMTKGEPGQTMPELVSSLGAGLLVTDYSPLRLGRTWREQVTSSLAVPFHEVDAHNIVPVWVASDKREYGARTIRPKVHKNLPEFLREYPAAPPAAAWPAGLHQPEPVDWEALLAEVTERGAAVPEVTWCKPGEAAALAALQGDKGFLTDARLGLYASKRNDPCVPQALSGLSPYLHYGQLSAQRAALEAAKLRSKHKEAVESFLEELVVRRELADNFCHYVPNYDSLDCAYDWAKQTLEAHRGDKREFVYTRDQLEFGRTHDELWNAAQLEMVYAGKMHGFMRMYWAKKVLEWTASPEEALQVCIYLNDKYELDGRDPSGYVGCMWSIAGIHDQGWAERPVFGKIRYMNYNGCKRKFDIKAYVAGVARTVREAGFKVGPAAAAAAPAAAAPAAAKKAKAAAK